MFNRLSSEGEAIVTGLINIAYFMRGAVQYNDLLLTMSYAERSIMSDFLDKRLEAAGKSHHPVY